MNNVELNYYSMSYYNIQISPEVVVECNDVIESLNMSYAEGNIIKALFRIARARQCNGKEGLDPAYDIEKIVYYSNRLHINNLGMFDQVPEVPCTDHRSVREASLLKPIRVLSPSTESRSSYKFTVEELSKALELTPEEREVLSNLVGVSLGGTTQYIAKCMESLKDSAKALKTW